MLEEKTAKAQINSRRAIEAPKLIFLGFMGIADLKLLVIDGGIVHT